MIPQYRYLIIGSGILGLSIARAIKSAQRDAPILIIDKEEEEAAHASSRNSGVLHAGFYYSADSLKAKLTARGNQALKEYCHQKNLPVNECGKLVVAQNETELAQLYELEKRGHHNGVKIEIIDEKKALEYEPNARTYQKALYSPTTATINPKAVCASLRKDLEMLGVQFLFSTKYLSHQKDIIQTSQGDFEARWVINCAGLYADTIAHDFGFGYNYTMLPFKGIYLKYTKNTTDVRMNIYPVPNLKNPFLGVHFTKTVEGGIKIGPTAMPAFWRENYHRFAHFNFHEFCQITRAESELFIKNAFNFRSLAIEETKKYNKNYLIQLAQKMVRHIDPDGFTEYTPAGIRAQLLNKKNLKLVQDFIIEGDQNSIHILNAVSPAFTCAFPFADLVIKNYALLY